MSRPQGEGLYVKRIHRHMDAMDEPPYREKNHNVFHSGTPDVFYSGTKNDLWVEYKYVTTLKLVGGWIRTSLSPRQSLWLRDRWAEGRNCRLIIGSFVGSIIIDGPEFKPEVLVEDLRNSALTEKQVAEWITEFCGPSIRCVFRRPPTSSG